MPRIVASVLIALFVNFVFADTLFIHTHSDSLGHSITHSHPYCPQSSHSHSSQSLDQIAGFNLAASCMNAAVLEGPARPEILLTTIVTEICIPSLQETEKTFSLRGPPAV